MRIVFGLCTLIGLQLAGTAIQTSLGLLIPGPVLGMVLLLILLMLLGERLLKPIELVSNWLVQHLSLLFIPITVGVVVQAGQYKHDALLLICVATLGTWLAMIGCGLLLKRWIGQEEPPLT